MSSLFKLSIKGIRAFEPEQEETIQFGFPLTLICGQNGCGKTTIIECLKYATTGDLPPNSKGGAFVNDPSLTGRTNVTGQVKLAFRNANGKSMITTRTIQLSRKKGKGGAMTNTFKTLEGQLVVIDKGNKVSVSSKNAELDSQTPIYLGASRAILDYVIFCHQDDSLWPLSEASVLKKRFDDIFEASKFTKVLDNLKVIKKDMAVDIKLIEQSVNHLKIDKDRAKKIHQRLETMKDASEKFNTDIANINIEIDKKEHEADDLFSLNQDFQAVLSEYDRLSHEKIVRAEQVERLKNTIEILDVTDEELLHAQQNFVSITKQKEEEVSIIEKKNNELNNQKESEVNQYNQLIRLEGSLRSKESDYKEKLASITKLIEEQGPQHNFQSTNNKSQDLKQFNKILSKFHSTHERELNELRSNYASQESKQKETLQEILDDITKQEQHILYSDNDISSNKEKVERITKKLTLLDTDENELEFKRADLESLRAKIATKKSLKEVQSLESEIELDGGNLSKLEFEIDELSKKLSTSNRQSELRTKLNLQQEALASKQQALNKLIDSSKAEYESATASSFDISQCEEKIADLLLEQNNLYDSENKKVRSFEAKVQLQESIAEMQEKEVRKFQEQVSSLKTKIVGVIEEDEIEKYEGVVDELEDSYRNVTEDINTFEVTRQFNVTAIKFANDQQSCLLCKRSFDSPGLEKFLEELQKSVNEERFKEIELQAQEIKQDMIGVKSINVDILSYRDYIGKIKELEPKVRQEHESLNPIKQELEVLNEKCKVIKDRIQNLNSLSDKITEIKRVEAEATSIEKVVEEFNEELQEFGTISLSVSELQKLQQNKNSEIKVLRSQIEEKSNSKISIQRELTKLEGKIKDIQLAISILERNLSEVSNHKNNLKDLESLIEQLENKKSETQTSLKKLYEEKNIKSSAIAEAVKKNQANLSAKESEVAQSKNILDTYNSYYQIIQTFESKDSKALQENIIQIESTSKKLDDLNSELERNQNEIKSLEKSINESSKEHHNILANLDYRSLLEEIRSTDRRITELDIDAARSSRDQYQNDSKRLRNEISSLRSDHDSKTGELKQLSDQIKRLQEELKTEYENVNSNYHEEWIKLQTNLLVSNDIQTYSKALDNAIMKFHSMKMGDINRILRELWSQTYKGSDIETIAIKSDVNVQTKGNRSYNYRVVMYKSGNELDMRGRCSAGQKVLTSILIRLALAECFGTNCGMIALDEPTTNLDQENSESLAEALNQIIEFRKSQSNFQLIVITHDENFLTHINGDRFTDIFYRIQRDEQQSSRIYSLPIHKMQDD